MANNTQDVFASYPPATSGVGKATFMKLTGRKLTNANPNAATTPAVSSNTPNGGTMVGGNNTYVVTLSLANSNQTAGVYGSVTITASLYDLANNFQSVAGSVTALSYNFLPTATGPGTYLSYTGTSGNNPNLSTGAVATVGAVSIVASAGVAVVTPVNLGQAVVEFRYPFAGENSALIGGNGPAGSVFPALQNDDVAANVLVNVVP